MGRYDTVGFGFTLSGTFQRIRFTSADTWVDATNKVLYVVANKDLLALPFSS